MLEFFSGLVVWLIFLVPRSVAGWTWRYRSRWVCFGLAIVGGSVLGAIAQHAGAPVAVIVLAFQGAPVLVLLGGVLRHQRAHRAAPTWRAAVRMVWQAARAWLADVWHWWREAGRYEIRWQRWLTWLALLPLSLFFARSARAGLPPGSELARVLSTAIAFAGPCFMVVMMLESILVSFGRVTVSDVLFRSLQRVVWLCFLVVVVAGCGPAVLDWVRDRPADAALAGAAVMIVVLVLRQVPVRLSTNETVLAIVAPARGGVSGIGAGLSALRPLGPRERHAVALHEAGHALLYAACDPWLDTITVTVAEQVRPWDALGTVMNNGVLRDIDDRATLEWRMLLLLAGQAADEAVRGTSLLGAVGDYAKWTGLAVRYLENGWGPVAVPEDERAGQPSPLSQALTILRDTQRQQLIALFQQNRDVVAALAAQLVAAPEPVTSAALRPFWQQMVFPPEFPRPHWTHDDADHALA